MILLLVVLRRRWTALGWSLVVEMLAAKVVTVLTSVLCLLEVVIGGCFRVFLALVELALEHLSQFS